MADFVFPPGGENVTVTAPNGITYVWDVDNGRWAIKSNSNKVTSTCHVGVAAPGSSVEGDLWYNISDPNDKKLYIYVNSVWEQAAPGWQEYQDAIDEAAKVFYGDDPPTDPSYELWYDTSLLELCVLHGGMWFPATAIAQEIPTLQQVLQAGPPIASQDIVLTNAENDIIDMSISEGRIIIGTVGEDLAPKFELRHKEGLDDSLALFEIDENGTRLDIEADGRIDNIHFRFNNEHKFILNKTGDAEFKGRVKAESAVEDNELVTYQQLLDVEQEIESISPSVERGEWSYSNNYHLDELANGDFFTGKIVTQDAHDAAQTQIAAEANECIEAAGNDQDAIDACTAIYVDAIHMNPEVGAIGPEPDFSLATHIVLSNYDISGKNHSFTDVVVGEHISVLDDNDDDFMMAVITEVDNVNPNYIILTINVLQSLGEADPDSDVKVRIFSVQDSVDATDFVQKAGDEMSGQLKIEGSVRTKPLLVVQPNDARSTDVIFSVNDDSGDNVLDILNGGQVFVDRTPEADSEVANKGYVDSKFNSMMPIGSIVFWGGLKERIPDDWVECRGQTAPTAVQTITGMTNIPNLQDYMPAGAGGVFGTTVGDTVDSKFKSHSHVVSRKEPGNTTGDPDDSQGTSTSRYRYWRGNASDSGISGSNINKTTTEVGDDITAPPVYLGVYIMKVN